jgi:hypothetical protein
MNTKMLSGLAVILALLCGFLVISIAYMSGGAGEDLTVDPVALPAGEMDVSDEGSSNGTVTASVEVIDNTVDAVVNVVTE